MMQEQTTDTALRQPLLSESKTNILERRSESDSKFLEHKTLATKRAKKGLHKWEVKESKQFFDEIKLVSDSKGSQDLQAVKFIAMLSQLAEANPKSVDKTNDCYLFLVPELPKELSLYKSNYIIVNGNPNQIFYIDKQANLKEIKINQPEFFKKNLQELIKKVKHNPVAFNMKKSEHNPENRKREKCSFQKDYSSIQDTLDKYNVQLGSAYGEGDCLFDAIAQGIEARGMTIPGDAKNPGYKKLRMICDTYLKESYKKDRKSWAVDYIKNDAKTGGPDLNTCLITMQYTHPEISEHPDLKNRIALWGRPHIEGKMICETLDIKLHVIEINKINLEDDDKSRKELMISHQLVDSKSSKTVDNSAINYDDFDTIHILVYNNHYIPVFPNQLIKKAEMRKPQTNLLIEEEHLTIYLNQKNLNDLIESNRDHFQININLDDKKLNLGISNVLAKDMVVSVISFLNIPEIMSLSLTCKEFNFFIINYFNEFKPIILDSNRIFSELISHYQGLKSDSISLHNFKKKIIIFVFLVCAMVTVFSAIPPVTGELMGLSSSFTTGVALMAYIFRKKENSLIQQRTELFRIKDRFIKTEASLSAPRL